SEKKRGKNKPPGCWPRSRPRQTTCRNPPIPVCPLQSQKPGKSQNPRKRSSPNLQPLRGGKAVFRHVKGKEYRESKLCRGIDDPDDPAEQDFRFFPHDGNSLGQFLQFAGASGSPGVEF